MSFRVEKTANYRTRCVATNPRPACFSSQESQINNALNKNLIYVPNATPAVIFNIDDINRGNAHYLVESGADVVVPTTGLLNEISFEITVLAGAITLTAPDGLSRFYVNNLLPFSSVTPAVTMQSGAGTNSNDINYPHKFVYKVSGDQPISTPSPAFPLIYPAWFKVL